MFDWPFQPLQCYEICKISQRARYMGPTWGPPGSCRPQMGPMLAPWTLLSGLVYCMLSDSLINENVIKINASQRNMDKKWFCNQHFTPHICIRKPVNIGSGNGLSPCWRQAIPWTNDDLLSIGPIGTYFSEIRIKTHNFSFTQMSLKMLFAKWWPFCPGGDELSWLKLMCSDNSGNFSYRCSRMYLRQSMNDIWHV